MRINSIKELKIDADIKNLYPVRSFVTKNGVKMGLNPRQVNHLKLSIDEACSNIIRHAYKEMNIKKKLILIKMTNAPKYVETKVIDWGKSFSMKLDSGSAPDLSKYVEIKKKGGLGLFMIQKFMDEVEHKRENNSNILIMRQNVIRPENSWILFKKNFSWKVISLKLKFSFISALTILALLSAIFLISTNLQKNSLKKQYFYNAKRTIDKLAANSISYILDNNDLKLTMLIKELKNKDDSVVYAGIVNAYNDIIAHTDVNKLYKPFKPPKLTDKNDTPLVNSWKIDDPDKNLLYFKSPIKHTGVTIGKVFIVLSENQLYKEIATFGSKLKFIFLTIFFWLLGVIGIYILGSAFIHPLKELTDEIRRISKEGMAGKLYFKGKGEFAEVAKAFNKMMGEIKLAEVELTDTTRLKKEMQLAKSIQHTLLPHEIPQLEGYDIGAKYEAAMEVGGDYYDFFNVSEKTLGIAVGDVSGKGIAGALVMTMTRTALRLEARNNKNAATVLGNLNTTLDGEFKKGMYITMFYVILDSQKRIINYASAGHNPMILYRSDTGQVYNFNPKGFAVGLNLGSPDTFKKAIKYETIKLRKGDLLFIYTDGITEAMNSKREEYGEFRLLQIIKKNHHLSAQEIADKTLDDIKKFAAGYPQSDDITYVVVKEKANVSEIEYNNRIKLFSLIENKNWSVKDACKEIGISYSQYYRLKLIKNKDGIAALKEEIDDSKRDIQRMDIEGSAKLLHLIANHSQYSIHKIHKTLNTENYGHYKISSKMISKELQRLNLTTKDKRARFAKREKKLREQGKKSVFLRSQIIKSPTGHKILDEYKKIDLSAKKIDIQKKENIKTVKSKPDAIIDAKLKEYQQAKTKKTAKVDLSKLTSYPPKQTENKKTVKNKADAIIDAKLKEYQKAKKK